MNPPRVLAFVMAGGQGTRLKPFTDHDPKPALPFGGSYRIVDFVLSNLYNSRLPRAHVLLQYRPEILVRHLVERWGRTDGPSGRFVQTILPRDLQVSEFRGTADSVAAALQCVDRADYDLIAVFAADHVYRMDVRQMIAFHRRRDADASVAAVPVAVSRAGAFGILCADREGRILGFQEKPARPETMPGDPARCYASMGNYLFRPAVLRAALADARARGDHDFGQHVLPRLVENHRVYAYDFADNRVPGVQPFEEAAYWRDVGTVDAYVEAQWDLLGLRPRFRIGNPDWPIRCASAPRVLGARGDVENSILGPGAACDGAAVRRSVLQRGAYVSPGAELDHCIVMDRAQVGHGVQLHDAIIGRGNKLQIASVTRRTDARRPRWMRSPAGMLIVPPRPRPPFARGRIAI